MIGIRNRPPFPFEWLIKCICVRVEWRLGNGIGLCPWRWVFSHSHIRNGNTYTSVIDHKSESKSMATMSIQFILNHSLHCSLKINAINVSSRLTFPHTIGIPLHNYKPPQNCLCILCILHLFSPQGCSRSKYTRPSSSSSQGNIFLQLEIERYRLSDYYYLLVLCVPHSLISFQVSTWKKSDMCNHEKWLPWYTQKHLTFS